MTSQMRKNANNLFRRAPALILTDLTNTCTLMVLRQYILLLTDSGKFQRQQNRMQR